MVMNVTTSVEHARNIKSFMYDELNMKSQSILFTGIPVLGSRDEYPKPLTELLDLPFARAGHDNFIISLEVR